jgi:hypothetical protein
MKLGTVLTACDLNPLYLDFIPIFIKAWKTLFPEINVFIILISDTLLEELNDYSENIKLVSPIENMHTAFQAQCIRLLYPQTLQQDDGVLITDMDMLPMNRFYYEDAIKNISSDTFISYRDVLLPHELPICYNIATPQVWKKMFQNETLEKWYTRANYDGNHGGSGWNIDQLVLIEKYNKYAGKKIILNDKMTRFNRLDRSGFNFNDTNLQTNIISGYYSDYHCLRPYSQYKQINDKIVDYLKDFNPNPNVKLNKFKFGFKRK